MILQTVLPTFVARVSILYTRNNSSPASSCLPEYRARDNRVPSKRFQSEHLPDQRGLKYTHAYLVFKFVVIGVIFCEVLLCV